MRLQIEATNQITEIEGVPFRVWKGRSEDGVECFVFVHRIAVARQADCSAFERALKEMPAPRAVPLSSIL